MDAEALKSFELRLTGASRGRVRRALKAGSFAAALDTIRTDRAELQRVRWLRAGLELIGEWLEAGSDTVIGVALSRTRATVEGGAGDGEDEVDGDPEAVLTEADEEDEDEVDADEALAEITAPSPIFVSQMADLHPPLRRLPIIVLDANVEVDLLKAIPGFDGPGRKIGHHKLQVGPEHAHVTLLRAPWARTRRLSGSAKDAAAAKRRLRSHSVLEQLGRQFFAAGKATPGKCGLITNKAGVNYLARLGLLDGVPTGSFMAMRGLNALEGVEELLVAGTIIPKMNSLETLTRSLFSRDPLDRLPKVGGYSPRLRGLRMRDGSAQSIVQVEHSCLYTNMVLEQIARSELEQAAGRARAAQRTIQNPVRIIIASQCIPNLTIDTVANCPVEGLELGAREALLAAYGIVPHHTDELMRLAAALFNSKRAARTALGTWPRPDGCMIEVVSGRQRTPREFEIDEARGSVVSLLERIGVADARRWRRPSEDWQAFGRRKGGVTDPRRKPVKSDSIRSIELLTPDSVTYDMCDDGVCHRGSSRPRAASTEPWKQCGRPQKPASELTPAARRKRAQRERARAARLDPVPWAVPLPFISTCSVAPVPPASLGYLDAAVPRLCGQIHLTEQPKLQQGRPHLTKTHTSHLGRMERFIRGPRKHPSPSTRIRR